MNKELPGIPQTLA